MTAIAYFEGRYVAEDQANVNIKTHAFLYGTSIFEGIRGYWNDESGMMYLFRLREHYMRMLDNLKLLHMKTELTVDDLMDISKELISRNEFTTDVYLQPRFYKSGISVPPGMSNIPTDFCCFAMPFGAYLDTEKGLSMCVSNWRRISDNAIPPRGKIGGAYVNTSVAMTDAHLNGFDDAILLTEDGYVSEGTGMNMFIVKNGTLITSQSTDNILDGITRGTIIELGRDRLQLPVISRSVNRSELYTADEIFLTGTAAQLAPVTSIDHRPIGTGKPGPITGQLQLIYQQVVHGLMTDYMHWLTEAPLHAPHA